MPGRIVEISMSVGQDAQTGDEICVLETMKMEQSVLLPYDGNVLEVFIQPGDIVQAGARLMEIG
jgi:biotin carboxyl carrier protein